MVRHLKAFIRDDDAASAIEYAMLLALIAAAIILTVQSLGGTLNNVFSNVDSILGGGGATTTSTKCCD